jgi:hypothetical protein
MSDEAHVRLVPFDCYEDGSIGAARTATFTGNSKPVGKGQNREPVDMLRAV